MDLSLSDIHHHSRLVDQKISTTTTTGTDNDDLIVDVVDDQHDQEDDESYCNSGVPLDLSLPKKGRKRSSYSNTLEPCTLQTTKNKKQHSSSSTGSSTEEDEETSSLLSSTSSSSSSSLSNHHKHHRSKSVTGDGCSGIVANDVIANSKPSYKKSLIRRYCKLMLKTKKKC